MRNSAGTYVRHPMLSTVDHSRPAQPRCHSHTGTTALPQPQWHKPTPLPSAKLQTCTAFTKRHTPYRCLQRLKPQLSRLPTTTLLSLTACAVSTQKPHSAPHARQQGLKEWHVRQRRAHSGKSPLTARVCHLTSCA